MNRDYPNIDVSTWVPGAYRDWVKPPSGKVTLPICFMSDFTGRKIGDRRYPDDLEYNVHHGFTVGQGKTMYWMMIWHNSGHVTVFNKETPARRYMDGGTIITIHFK
jgi:hypothetical protein